MRGWILTFFVLGALYFGVGFLFPSETQQMRNMGFEMDEKTIFQAFKALPADLVSAAFNDDTGGLDPGKTYEITKNRNSVKATFDRYSSTSGVYYFSLADNSHQFFAIESDKLSALSLTEIE